MLSTILHHLVAASYRNKKQFITQHLTQRETIEQRKHHKKYSRSVIQSVQLQINQITIYPTRKTRHKLQLTLDLLLPVHSMLQTRLNHSFFSPLYTTATGANWIFKSASLGTNSQDWTEFQKLPARRHWETSLLTGRMTSKILWKILNSQGVPGQAQKQVLKN